MTIENTEATEEEKVESEPVVQQDPAVLALQAELGKSIVGGLPYEQAEQILQSRQAPQQPSKTIVSAVSIVSESSVVAEVSTQFPDVAIGAATVSIADRIHRILNPEFLLGIRQLDQGAALINRIIKLHRAEYGEPSLEDMVAIIEQLRQQDSVPRAVDLLPSGKELRKKILDRIAGKVEKRGVKNKKRKNEDSDEDNAEGDGFVDDDWSEKFEEIDYEALGIDPAMPTEAKPGTEEKVLVLSARYAAGVPLWHQEDNYTQGPGASAARLIRHE